MQHREQQSLARGKRARQKPNAASVPSVVAISVAAVPTIRLFFSDGSQNVDEKKSSYQRRLTVQAAGKCRNEPDENDSGTMTTIGATRKTSTRPAKHRKAYRPSRWRPS